jgi:dTDP-4-amino-4,6-dideoxygalactose transaminase
MATTPQLRLFATPYPTLRWRMTLPRGWRKSPPFPFDNQALHYFYMARNGIYALAKLWNLANQEVLFPAYFHGIEIESLLAARVKLKFYPVHSGMRVDVDEIGARISPSTRAVYMIHYVGFPGPVQEVSELCRRHGIRLIEDCALALLSKLGDQPLGSFGDAAIFNLYKTLPVPNGGALLVRLAGAARLPKASPPSLSSTMAYTATAAWRHLKFQTRGSTHRLLQQARKLAKSRSDKLGVVQVGSEHFDLSQSDLAMSRLCHWILAAQDFPQIVARRRRNYQRLMDHLKDLSPPVFPGLPRGVCPLFYPLQTRNKLKVIEHLFGHGVDAGNYWSQSLPILPEGNFPEVDALRQSIVELPCHQDFTTDDMDWIADLIRTAW